MGTNATIDDTFMTTKMLPPTENTSSEGYVSMLGLYGTGKLSEVVKFIERDFI